MKHLKKIYESVSSEIFPLDVHSILNKGSMEIYAIYSSKEEAEIKCIELNKNYNDNFRIKDNFNYYNLYDAIGEITDHYRNYYDPYNEDF